MATDLTEQEVQDKLLAIRRQQQISETISPSRTISQPLSNVSESVVNKLQVVQPEPKTVCTTETCKGYCGRVDCPWPAAKRFYDLEQTLKAIRQQRRHPERVLRVWKVPKKHIASSFENFQGGDAIKALCMDTADREKSIFMSGATGCGKTHLAVAMMRRRIETSSKHLEGNSSKPPVAIFTTVPELLFEIRQCYRDGGPSEAETVRKYADVPLLVLDDLGAEKDTTAAEAMLYLIIDRRDRECRWTIVTSNVDLAELQNTLGARIASRLSNMIVAPIKLGDYRKKRTA
ncbi:MAG: DNA replication protein DnaC [Syntrophorhabdus sp. PtaU1.Bin153]|nr:MAG: DNA replication protein DnaC [Syntrophorhabdus sp. PtaU1.Bin153]